MCFLFRWIVFFLQVQIRYPLRNGLAEKSLLENNHWYMHRHVYCHDWFWEASRNMELQMVSVEVSIPWCFGALENLPWMNTIQHHTTICQILETSMNQTTCSKRIQLVFKNLKIPYHEFRTGQRQCWKYVSPNWGPIPHFSPHLCVGFLFLVVHFRLLLPPAARHHHTTCLHNLRHHTTCSHNLLTHNLHTQNLLTQLPHTHNLLTHNLLTHNLCPHSLTHNLSPHNLLTHNLLTHNLSPHNLPTHTLLTHNLLTTYSSQPTYSHTTCHHTIYSHTHSHTHTHTHTPKKHTHTHTLLTHNLRGRRGTWWHRPSICVADVALMALDWPWWRAWFPVHAGVAAALCVAGVALGDVDLYFAWQAWHLATSTCILCGRRGTYGTGLALVARLVPSWRRCRCGSLRGRRGTWRRRPRLCVAGVALGDMDVHFAWQAWHLWHWTGSGGALGSQLTPLSPPLLAWQAWHLVTSTSTFRGRRGTWRHRRAFCVAGVTLMALDWHWWRAWFSIDAVVSAALCVAGGTWRHRRAFCVAGVALGDTLRGRRGTYGTGLALVARLVPSWRRCCRSSLRGRRSTWRRRPRLSWQAWHVATSTVTLRGRRGTWPHGSALCVARVALLALDWHWTGTGGALGSQLMPLSPRLFARQAWHLATSTCIPRGGRGTWCHGHALCVAGVALMALDWLWWRAWFPLDAGVAAALCVAEAWHLVTSTSTLRGRRGTWRHRPSLCVAGVALGAMDMHFAWQAWHLWHWTGSGGALGAVGAAALCLAGVALGDIHDASEAISLTTLSPTTLSHTHTHNFVTGNLSHTHNSFTHNLSCTQLFHSQPFTHNSFTHNFVTHNSSHTTPKMIDPPPSPLSVLLSPCHFNHFFWLLDEVDLWGYPVL